MTIDPAAEVVQANVLEQRLGRPFANRELLRNALTHSTYANENPNEGPDFERLEFLGDAVLDLLAARLLFDQLGEAKEGELSRRRARVVRRDTLAVLANELGLGEHIRLGEGQKRSGGGASKRILADAFEALAGAIYLDGGYQAVEQCLARYILSGIAQTQDPLDFKTRLQEACHRMGLPVPAYQVVAVEGPDHARNFTCDVHVRGEARGRGLGTNKKAAEQMCARQALESLLKNQEN